MNDESNGTLPAYDAYPLDVMAIVRLLLVGAVAGALGWLLYLGLAQYFIEPVFCKNAETFSVCRNGGSIAWISAHVIVLAATVAVLARLAIYRPLLVALAVFICLWGAHSWLGGMTWYGGLIWQAVLFGLAVALFGWLARYVNFIVTLIAMIAAIIVARLVLMLA